MPQHIALEHPASLIWSILFDGMAIRDAAKTYLVSEATIRDVVRRAWKSRTSRTEVGRLRCGEQQPFKAILSALLLDQAVSPLIERRHPMLSGGVRVSNENK